VDTLAARARKAYKRGLDRGLCAYAAIAAPRALVSPRGAPQPFEMAGNVGLRSALAGAAVCAGVPALLAALRAEVVPWLLNVPAAAPATKPAPAAVSPNGVRRVYRLLCDLAWSDGSVVPAERTWLAGFCARHAISPGEAMALEAEARAKKGFKLTRRAEEQILLVDSMVALVLADGVVAPEERRRAAAFARTLGLDPAAVEERLHAAAARPHEARPASPGPPLRATVSPPDASGSRVLAFPAVGARLLLPAAVPNPESLAGDWWIASKDAELPQPVPTTSPRASRTPSPSRPFPIAARRWGSPVTSTPTPCRATRWRSSPRAGRTANRFPLKEAEVAAEKHLR
jgi:hypothetical protein